MNIQNFASIPMVTSGRLSSAQECSLEKALEFTKFYSAGKIKMCDAYNGLTGTAKTLEFSEGVCSGLQFLEDGVKNHGLQFAEAAPFNFNLPLVGNWTVGTLNLLIQDIGSNTNADTVLSAAFPDKPVNQYDVILDRISANTGIAPEISEDTVQLPTIRPLDTRGMMYTSGSWGGQCMISSKHIAYDRRLGAGTLDERGYGQRVAFNTINASTMMVVRKKQLINDAVFLNGFSYSGANISSNIPTENFIALDPMGTLNSDGTCTYSNPDPYYNPVIAVTNIIANPLFRKYQHYIVGVVMNILDLRNIMNHPQVKPVTNAWTMGSTSLTEKKMTLQVNGTTKEIAAYYAPSFDIPFIADDGVWEGQNADGTGNNDDQNFFVPQGKMYVLMDYSKSTTPAPNGAFHLTINQWDPNTTAPRLGMFLAAVPFNINNSMGSNSLHIIATLAGAPAMYRPESQFILTTLYSNV